MLFITRAAGFIGANFVHHWPRHSDEALLAIDALTYTGNLERFANVLPEPMQTNGYGQYLLRLLQE